MIIDHVTYQVSLASIADDRLAEFFRLLDFEEVEAAEPVPDEWLVRWFKKAFTTYGEGWPLIHVVAQPDRKPCPIGLAHFAVRVGPGRYISCAASEFCVRDNPASPRVWLEFGGIRAEVRA